MQSKNEAREIIDALTVCAEITGADMSVGAARVMAQDLARYPHQQVIGSLARCRRELRNRLTLADIIARLDDGRPEPEEAWSIVAGSLQDESVTVVWTQEMAEAFGIALGLSGDRVAARMAFKESYEKAVAESRRAGKPVSWSISLGHDRHGRDGPLLAAVAKGLLALEHVAPHLVGETAHQDALRLTENLKILQNDGLDGLKLPVIEARKADASAETTA